MQLKPLRETPLWTALITPFLEDGNVDFISMEHLLKKQAEASLGVVLLGSTGENLALSLEEKHLIIESALSYDLKIPFMVGVQGFNLKEQLSFIKSLRRYHLDALLLVTPLYAKPGIIGQTQWFKALMDESPFPCMLYNVPSRTGVSLHPEVLSKLSEHPNLWALKESSGSVEQIKNYQKVNSHIHYYCGDDGLMPDFAQYGVKGLVSVASNCWPWATLKYVQMCLKKPGVSPDSRVWPTACDALFTAANPIPAKALLKHLNLIQSACTRPPLSAKDLKGIGNLVEANQLVKNWELTL